ncbi:MAG TPA: serine hydroxymethyltransferase [archaeon]|jgi:glycine hydroxymethyltransferase|nr:serine hydroxymethyltransferase [archaeon]HPV66321.1 serine hydroxymethyltransferase [archaeon]
MTTILELIKKEKNRQQETVEMIASENICSKEIREACGSVLTNKYAEGYPGKRYYSGCEVVDEIEDYAREKAKELFNCKYSNVQPHSGSSANLIAYFSLLEKGDNILGMSLDSGGHLTHGFKLNFSGRLFESYSYGTDDNGFLDYDEIERLARTKKPKMIVCGASAYPRKIDFERFREISDSVGAYLMADMAHIAGLVATKLHESPLPYADIVTSTTHKTLRGPRGGLILTDNEEIGGKISKNNFPGFQGGPLEHIIAGKAICFEEALRPDFKIYQEQVLRNSKTLAEELQKYGFKLVTDGTDNHLILVDLRNKNITGKVAQEVLEEINISINKNAIPKDPQKPFITSGIRIGTPAITTRGFKEQQIKVIADYINQVICEPENQKLKSNLKGKIIEMLKEYPIDNI